MNSRRLKAASSMSRAGQLTNSCSMSGSVFSASAPQAAGSTGTARQPASSSPGARQLRGERCARGGRLRRLAREENQSRRQSAR